MIKMLIKKLIGTAFTCYTFNASAVHINPQGISDVSLVPYYTVNNNLNTLVTVTNTRNTAKAVKINFREGLNGYAVLSYNVYLDSFDTWSFALVETQSTVSGYAGQNSVRHVTSDTSCAPFLLKSGQEFLPFEFIDGPNDLSRAREGFIEVIEMGELTGEVAGFVSQFNAGVPADCGRIIEAWTLDGIWDEPSGGDVESDVTEVTGGLMVNADIINVAEGINFSVPVVALDGFFAEGTIAHTSPGDTNLSLDAAEPKATVVTREKVYELDLDSGIDAVSAVLMADELIAAYALDTVVVGKSETVFVQPTRRFYFDSETLVSSPPYGDDIDVGLCSDSTYGGSEVDVSIFDREAQIENSDVAAGPIPVGFPTPAICGSVFAYQLVLPGQDGSDGSITGSSNTQLFTSPTTAVTESGFHRIDFLATRSLSGTDANTNTNVEIMGLPVIGVTFQQFTNAAAGQGLLAQYGGTQKVKSTVSVIEQ